MLVDPQDQQTFDDVLEGKVVESASPLTPSPTSGEKRALNLVLVVISVLHDNYQWVTVGSCKNTCTKI